MFPEALTGLRGRTMYLSAYQDILEAAPSESRRSEREALLYAAELLKVAEAKGPRSNESVAALFFVRRLWTFFVEQLAQSSNPLPKDVRAKLISIGIWVLGEEEKIRMGQSTDYAAIADISRTIALGLKS